MNTIELNGITYENIPNRQRSQRAVLEFLCNLFVPRPLFRAVAGTSHSPLIAETFRRPGSWQSMRIIYENARPVDFMDRMALKSNPISVETRNRRRLVVPKLAEILQQMRAEEPLQIVGVGAGPGVLIQEALAQSELPREQFSAYLFDLDAAAGARGRELAEQNGIADQVEFVAADARSISAVLPEVRPHLVKIVGLLEYLTDEEVVDLLITMHRAMRDGGKLLTHGFDDRFRAGRFLSRMFGLTHTFRTGDAVESLLREAGFEQFDRDETPLGVYPVLVATR